MVTEHVFATRAARAVLRTLQDATLSPHEKDLARFLANRMNDELTGGGLRLVIELAFYDLARGKSGFQGESIPGSLTGLQANVLAALRLAVPGLFAKAGAPRLASELADANGEPK